MKGLLLKDYFYVKDAKWILSIAPILSLTVLVLNFWESMGKNELSLLAACIPAMMAVFSLAIALIPPYIDNTSGSMKIIFTQPVSRHEFLKARYIFQFISAAVCILSGFVCGLITMFCCGLFSYSGGYLIFILPVISFLFISVMIAMNNALQLKQCNIYLSFGIMGAVPALSLILTSVKDNFELFLVIGIVICLMILVSGIFFFIKSFKWIEEKEL